MELLLQGTYQLYHLQGIDPQLQKAVLQAKFCTGHQGGKQLPHHRLKLLRGGLGGQHNLFLRRGGISHLCTRLAGAEQHRQPAGLIGVSGRQGLDLPVVRPG